MYGRSKILNETRILYTQAGIVEKTRCKDVQQRSAGSAGLYKSKTLYIDQHSNDEPI